jgi:hypothetical protein
MSGNNGLTVTESNTLSACETDIERARMLGWEARQLAGEALRIIHEGKLYKGYGTFRDYCLNRWEWDVSYCYRLIKHEETKANLLEHLETSPIGDVLSEAATREIADLPPEQQVEVVKKAAENSKKPTAAAVKAARETVAPKPKNSSQANGSGGGDQEVATVPQDKEGHDLPAGLLGVFDIGKTISKNLNSINALVKACVDAGLPTFPASAVKVAIKDLRSALKAGLPHAVCPYCSGRKCSSCEHGYVTKDQWAGIPEERRK